MRRLFILCFVTLILVWNNAKAGETEPNNIPAQANILPLNGSSNGIINPAGDVDWWKVKTTSDGQLSVTLTPVSGQYMYVFLYDTAGVVQIAGTYGASPFTIGSDGLAAGTYYLQVYCYNPSDTSSYTISNTLTPASVANDKEPDSSRATALTLALDNSTTGHINYYYNNHRDSSDWYKVTTNADGLFRLTLNPVNGQYVYLTLYDNDGVTILNQTYGASAFNISKDGLAAGTYYVEVSPYNSSYFAPYILSDSLFITGIGNDKEPDNSRTQADSLPLNGIVSGHTNYYYNHYSDSSDWYKVTTNADGLLRLTLNPVNGQYVYLTLYDNDGLTVLKQTYGASAFNITTDGLAAGTYYVEVSPYNSSYFAPYILSDSLFTTGIGNDKEPDSSRAQANSLPLDATVTGHVNYYYNHYKDSSDWYKVTTNADGLLRLTLNPVNGQYVYLTLYDNDGSTIISQNYGASAFNMTIDGLAAGTYYVEINPYSSDRFAPYILSDSLFTYNKNDIEPNAYFSEAATISANRTVTGHAGFYYKNARDTVDTWKINYTGTSGNLNLTLNLLPHNINGGTDYMYFQVYKDTASAPIYSNYTESASTAINLAGLAQGYYYIKIFGYSVNNFDAYSITDSFTQVNKASISLLKAASSINSCGSDSLVYKLGASHSPYTVRLYRDNKLFDSLTTTSDTARFTGLNDGNYFATVYGDGATDSAYSKSITSQFLPPFPTALASSVGVHTATLNWSPFSCVQNYRLQYKVTGSAAWITINTLKDTSGTYYLTGLNPYTTYTWQVASVDSVNGLASPYSDTATFKTFSDTAHITFVHLGQGSGCSSDTLKYVTSNSVSPYSVQLYRNGIAYRSMLMVNDTATFTSLPAGNYYATATGTGSGGSLGISDTTQLTPPAPMGLSSSGVTSNKAKLHWSGLSCASYYIAQYRPKGSTTWKNVNTVNDSVALSNLISDTTYFWHVASVDSSNGQSDISPYSSIDSFVTLSALPVTFIYFDGVLQNNQALLSWSTATETNNKGFEVEKSIEGQTFTGIDFVQGDGNSGIAHNYNFTDIKVTSGPNYYRLKQIDFDGGFIYSSVIRLDYSKFGWSILGNPVNSGSWIQLQLDKAVNVSIQIISVNGNIIKTINKGNLSAGTYSVPLNLSNASSGTYVVRLLINNKTYSQRIIK